MNFQFKKQFSFEKRLAEGNKARKQYPDRIPVVVEKAPNAKIADITECKKYLVPLDMNMGQFYYVIRKKIFLRPEAPLYFFVASKSPHTLETFGSLYYEYRDKDSFLYVAYSDKNVYGGEVVPDEKEQERDEQVVNGNELNT